MAKAANKQNLRMNQLSLRIKSAMEKLAIVDEYYFKRDGYLQPHINL